MSIRIGLIGDVHATPAPLEEALQIMARQQVDTILCTGDIASYGDNLEACVELLIQSQCHVISGNHDRWHLEKTDKSDFSETENWLSALPSSLSFSFAGKRLYLVHSRPPDHDRHGIKLLDKQGELIPEQIIYWQAQLEGFDYDVLVVGHSHQVYAQQLGSVLLINPGSTAYNNVCAVLHLPAMKVEFFPLNNKPIVKSWNWGMYEAGFRPGS